MPTANVSATDRIIRALIGAGLMVWFFMDQGLGPWNWTILVIGVIVLGTAVLSFCPIYRLLGTGTN
jgi:hypothetical protein